MFKKAFKNDLESQLLINIFIDNELKFTHLANPLSTLEELKQTILLKTSHYSINYKMEYNEVEISHLDKFTLFQIFNKVVKDEYNIYLTLISTMKKYENQKILMTYKEGEQYILLYKMLSMKWNKVIPNIINRVSFYKTKKFPYNSRYCHVPSLNQIVITGGLDSETNACYYDSDTNSVVDLPPMKHKRERHAMVYVGDSRVFIIGGDNSKKVTCLNIDYESYEEYPDMKYERKDASVCYVNNKYLYVFMGYCNDLGGIANNFEKLDISLESYETKWTLLPINNPHDLKVPRTYSGVLYFEGDFFFLGGARSGGVDSYVYRFEEGINTFSFQKSKYVLPLEGGFNETMFVRSSEMESDFYQFTFGTHHLIHFNPKTEVIEEIQKEWINK